MPVLRAASELLPAMLGEKKNGISYYAKIHFNNHKKNISFKKYISMDSINKAGQKLMNFGNGLILLLIVFIIYAGGFFFFKVDLLTHWAVICGIITLVLIVYSLSNILEASKLLISYKVEIQIQRQKDGSLEHVDETHFHQFNPKDFPNLTEDLRRVKLLLLDEEVEIFKELILSISKNYSISKELRNKNIELASRIHKFPISSYTSLYDKNRLNPVFIHDLEEYLNILLR